MVPGLNASIFQQSVPQILEAGRKKETFFFISNQSGIDTLHSTGSKFLYSKTKHFSDGTQDMF